MTTIWQANAALAATTRDQYVTARTNDETARATDDLRAIAYAAKIRRTLGWGLDNSVLTALREYALNRAGAELLALEAFGAEQ